jgi:hypothetical protein
MLGNVHGAHAESCWSMAFLMKKGPALRQSLLKLAILFVRIVVVLL